MSSGQSTCAHSLLANAAGLVLDVEVAQLLEDDDYQHRPEQKHRRSILQ
eukprot:COSAG06_NODE_2527_length_6720_cov_2.669687_7_plen_49_part_00